VLFAFRLGFNRRPENTIFDEVYEPMAASLLMGPCWRERFRSRINIETPGRIRNKHPVRIQGVEPAVGPSAPNRLGLPYAAVDF
jgi:hypothetical protein